MLLLRQIPNDNMRRPSWCSPGREELRPHVPIERTPHRASRDLGAVLALAPIVGVILDKSPDVARPQFFNGQNGATVKTKCNKVHKSAKNLLKIKRRDTPSKK